MDMTLELRIDQNCNVIGLPYFGYPECVKVKYTSFFLETKLHGLYGQFNYSFFIKTLI